VETVGLSLATVIQQMNALNCPYTVKITRPTRDFFELEGDSLYVIRQQVDTDGTYHLVAAAKMGKEVF
jgi:hypothetical protein